MRIRTVAAIGASLILCTGFVAQAFADELKPIQLPAPKLDAGKSLVQALTDRKSQREFTNGALSQQILSNLLWAAWGINRQDTGKRTAPSSFNRQEIDVYVTKSEGAYRYDPKGNALVPVASGDIRALTGTQSYFRDAGINLVYVSNLSKMGDGEEATKMFTTAADTGFIGQNVYLYCASEGLATVFRAGIDKPKLAEALKLKPDQRITFAQTVGLPKSAK